MLRRQLALLAGLSLLAAASAPAQETGGAVSQPARTSIGSIEGQQLAGGSEYLTATADARRSLSIAVYNNDHALVRESRELPLLSGVSLFAIADVPSQLKPGSIRFQAPEGVSIQSLRFEPGAPSYQRLLQDNVGKQVTLIREHPETGERIEQRAQLIALADGQPVLRLGDRVEVAAGRFPWRIAFPGRAGQAIWQSAIVAEAAAEESRAVVLELSYLTGGLGWQADYDLVLAPDSASADLEGWASIANDSGADFSNARVELVAGDVAVAEQQGPTANYRFARESADAGAPERTAMGGAYHRYTLSRRVSLADGQSLQLPLLESAGLKVERLFRVSHNTSPRPAAGGPLMQPVSVAYTLQAESDLPQPLPAGVVRVYQRDGDGALQWLGEDRIDHTPVDAPLTVTVGRAFDVRAERRQTDYTRLSDRSYESAWTITLSNASEQPAQVLVEEQMSGDWEVMEADPAPESRDAGQLQWRVNVPAGESVNVSYRVRVKY